MFICANCRHFVDVYYLEQCHNCQALVCSDCFLVLENKDDMAYRCDWMTLLCSNCQCAGNCIEKKPFNIIVGSKCVRCKLQYCDQCFERTQCGNNKHVT